MISAVDWQQARSIVELGAGTGVITQSINEHRSDESVFVSFEKDEQMHRELSLRFPDIVTGRDAFSLIETLEQCGQQQVDCVLSGLPFANFTRNQQFTLLTTIHNVLRPGGRFIAFQYSLQLQAWLKSIYASVDCRFVVRNIPPAFVYICRKHIP
jgi:phospholipid N-methyltransferase